MNFGYHIFLFGTLFVQSFHMIEHIAQVVEKFALHWTRPFGVLGTAVDIEPVHFAYNLTYLALIVISWLLFRNKVARYSSTIKGLFAFAIASQSWHFIEHSTKLEQHLVQGCVSCPGILGVYFDPVLLHFIYNVVVFAPFVVAFFLINRSVLPEKVSETRL